MNFLLDTCVISDLTSSAPNTKVVAWIDSLSDDQVFISVVTIGEIKRGINRLPDSRRKRTLEDWLHHGVLMRFQKNIVILDAPVILAWGALCADLDKLGTPMPALDSLIAASAAFHHLTLATRNIKDFKSASIKLFNPWH